jgi:uncharacterized membrane protein YbaN (DUF454 family)
MRILAAPARSACTLPEPNAYRVVHSSHGRLRIHLDNWSASAAEQFVARLQAVPGVSSAAASAITENVLVQYDPRQCSLDGLLSRVSSTWQQARQDSPHQTPPLTLFPPEASASQLPVNGGAHELVAEASGSPVEYQYVTGLRRTLYLILGWASVGMAIIGAILPGIPTAPFVILAGYFFIRSSRTAHEWLRRSRWFGPILRDWEEHHGIRRSIRNFAVGLICFSMVLITLFGLPLPLLLTIWVTQIIGLIIVLCLRVVEQPSPAPVLAAP